MPDIYHIIPRGEWEAASASGTYAPSTLEHDGFIHCCKRWQILTVADAYYQGREGLLLLRIDTERVLPEIRSEDAYEQGQLFPHIYGPLDVQAVTEVIEFPPGEDGSFSLPPQLG